MRRLLILSVCALSLMSCGDPLQTTTYQGEPRIVIDGVVATDFGDALPPPGRYRVNVFWLPRSLEFDDTVESSAASADVSGLGSFRLWLFDEPLTHRLRTQPYALGLFLVYRDSNGNGRRDATEEIYGSDRQTAMLWSPTGIAATDRLLAHAVQPGYRLLRMPLRCGADVTPSVGDPEAIDVPDDEDEPVDTTTTITCDTPLGNECQSDDDCGLGICTEQLVGASVGRTCTLPISPEFPPCIPSHALAVPASGAAFDRLEASTTWARACGPGLPCVQTDDHCAPGIGICLPPPTVRVELEATADDFLDRDVDLCFVDRYPVDAVPDSLEDTPRWPFDVE